MLYYAGLVGMLFGGVPLIRRAGGPLEIGLVVGGGVLIALGIVIAAVTARAPAPNPPKVGEPAAREGLGQWEDRS